MQEQLPRCQLLRLTRHMLALSTGSAARIALLLAFTAGSLTINAVSVQAETQQSTRTKQQSKPLVNPRCPSAQQVESALGEASGLLEQEQYATAADKLGTLARLDCDARFSLLLAAAFEGEGKIREAEEVLQHAHSVWKSNNSIAASLARTYMSRGQVDKAVDALDTFHAKADTPLQELDTAAVVFLAGHQLVSAQAVAQAAYTSYPSLQSLLLWANTLQLEGRYKNVIALLQDKRPMYAQLPAFLVTLAESEYDADMLDQARQDLESAIKLNATIYQAQYVLGNVLMKQGELDQSASAYRTAISLSPDQPRTYYQLALVLRAKQDEASEESVLAKALAIDDHYAAAHAEMGRILLNQNRLPEAVDQLNSAIKDNPTLEQPYNLLARAYDRLGDTDKASATANQLALVRLQNHKLLKVGDKGPGPGSDLPR